MGVSPQPMVLPAYGAGAVTDVFPAVCARLGVPAAADVFDLPAGRRWVVLLIDGLGEAVLQAAGDAAPFLAPLRAGGRVITAGTPSTTVTSLACLGTGLPPGQHGMAGYSFRIQRRQVLNALLWDTPLQAHEVQSCPTWFERAKAAGVSVRTVSPARFEGSGLTLAALRGADFTGLREESDVDAWIEGITTAVRAGDRSFVYAYERMLDHVGHSVGVTEAAYAETLTGIDARVARLRAALPEDVRLVITADHGMVDVPGRNFVVAEREPGLLADVSCLAGEGRLRHLYTANATAVAARWSDRMGEHAWVRTRDEAIDEGWFGPVADRVRDRFGDVLIAMRTDWAVMSTLYPREFDLVGMHGSLTPAEMRVPLLVI